MGIVKDLLGVARGAAHPKDAPPVEGRHERHARGERLERHAHAHGHGAAAGTAAAESHPSAGSAQTATTPAAKPAAAVAPHAPEHVAEFQASRNVIEEDERLILAHTREVADFYMIFKAAPTDKANAGGAAAQAAPALHAVHLVANQKPLVSTGESGSRSDATAAVAPVMRTIEEHVSKLQHAIMVDYARETAQKGAQIAMMGIPGVGMAMSVPTNVGVAVAGNAGGRSYIGTATTKTKLAISKTLIDFNAASLAEAKKAGRPTFVRMAWVCQPVALTDTQHEAMYMQLNLDKQNYIKMARTATNPTEAAVGRVSALQLTDMSDSNCYVVGMGSETPEAAAVAKGEQSVTAGGIVNGALGVVGTVLDGDKRKDARKQYGAIANLKFRDESAAGQWKRAKEAKFKGVPVTGKYCVRQFVLLMEDHVDEYEAVLNEQVKHLDELKKRDAAMRPKPASILPKKAAKGQEEEAATQEPPPPQQPDHSEEENAKAEPFMPPVQRVLMQFPVTSTSWSPDQDINELFKCTRIEV